MKEIKAGQKLDKEQQVYSRIVEYKDALIESLYAARRSLKAEELITAHIDYAKIFELCEDADVEDHIKQSSQERERMCNELQYVIKKIEFQLDKIKNIEQWMLDNYEILHEIDKALNGVFNFEATREFYNSLKG